MVILGLFVLEDNFLFSGFPHVRLWGILQWKLVEPFMGLILSSCWTLWGDATETASALFVVLLEKEKKGLCKHHEACHDTAEN